MAIFNDLATEIWIQILQEVTAVPDDLLDPELILVVESCGTLMLSDFAEQRCLEALTHKRRVSQVCQKWRAISLPFLFEHVVIKRLSQLEGLAALLSHMINLDAGGLRPIGSYTERLDLLMGNEPSKDLLPETQALIGIFGVCPNMVLINWTSWANYAYTLPEIMASIPRGLKTLNWIGLSSISPRTSTLCQSFLADHPNISSAHLVESFPRLEMNELESIASHAAFPSVRQLVTVVGPNSGPWHTFHPTAFPNLQRAVIAVAWPISYFLLSPPPVPFVDAFFAPCGRRLKSLSINWTHEGPAHDDLLFTKIQQWCPVLEELSLTSSVAKSSFSLSIASTSIRNPLMSLSGHPTLLKVHTLGIERYEAARIATQDVVKEVLDRLLHWAELQHSVFPNLQTLRLRSEAVVAYCHEHTPPDFKRLLDRCDSLGVSVVDHFSRTLNKPPDRSTRALH